MFACGLRGFRFGSKSGRLASTSTAAFLLLLVAVSEHFVGFVDREDLIRIRNRQSRD